MTRHWLATLILVATAACGAGSASQAPAGPPAAFAGSRGINLHTWFTWPKQLAADHYAFPAFQNQPGEITPAEAKRLRGLGFDFVRLTVEPGVFMSATGADRTQAVGALLAGVDLLRRAGLSVIVDLHPNSRFQPDPSSSATGAEAVQKGAGSPVAKRYEASAAALASLLDKRYGGDRTVALELLNEPTLPCGAVTWRAQQASLHRAVRAAAPRLTLVLTGTCWSGIDGLTALHPADYADPNVLYTFHFYEDHRFTHQGMHNEAEGNATTGLPYPSDARSEAVVMRDVEDHLQLLPDRGAAMAATVRAGAAKYLAQRWTPQKIDARFQLVADWADQNGVPKGNILLGEFGVNGLAGTPWGAEDADRLRWLHDVRESADRYGFRWAFFTYRSDNSGMHLETDRATGELDTAVLNVLAVGKAR